ncbi:MAG: peptide deformylase [Deltaproteobacteria bacterium]
MALLSILKYPDRFLRTKAEPVASVDDPIKTLVSDMAETMFAARGIGLAAVQVGVAKRVIVADVPKSGADDEERERHRGENIIALINPVIVSSGGDIRYDEGCLSVPGITAEVARAENVVVKALSKQGREITIEASGLLAIVLQHEIDHLDGILFIDRLSRLKREIIKRRLKKSIVEEEARAAF